LASVAVVGKEKYVTRERERERELELGISTTLRNHCSGGI